MALAIHRSVVQNLNDTNQLDANLGPSASRVAVNAKGTTVFTSCQNQVYTIPVPVTTTTEVPSTKPINHPNTNATPHRLHTHESPVQSIATQYLSDQTILASVDTFGRVKWSACTHSMEEDVYANTLNNTLNNTSKTSNTSNTSNTITRDTSANIESGWSGLSLGPFNQMAVVQHFDRTLSIGNLHSGTTTFQSTAHLSGCPTDVGFCGGTQSDSVGGQLVATTENNAVVLYDLRQKNGGGAPAGRAQCGAPVSTHRQAPSFAHLRAIATPETWPANILAASDDRFVYTIEPRNWRVLRRWRTPLKYEPVGLLRSPSHSSLCYIAGLDNDIMCGNVGGPAQLGGDSNNNQDKKRKREFTQLQMMFSTGFRGDGPWAGVAVRNVGDDSNDILYAVSQSCGLYVVEGATGLLDMRES